MHLSTALEYYRFEKYLLEVAIITLEKGGSASKLDTYEFLPPIDAWGFPKYPGKTAILSSDIDLVAALRKFVTDNELYLRETDSWLGTWIHPATRDYYLDITTSCIDLEEAKREAIVRSHAEERKIVALYNTKRDQTVYL